MAQRLEEAIRSAKRRSGAGQSSGSQTPTDDRDHARAAAQQHSLPRSKRHDEKLANDREEDEAQKQEQYDHQPPLCRRRRPQTPLAPPPPPSASESISTDDGSAILVDDEDDDDYAISPHMLSPYTQRNYQSHDSEEPGQDEDEDSASGGGDNLPWSTRTDADIEARLERLPMNRRRTPETYMTGKEMVEAHVMSVEEFKVRTRDRLGLRASGEQRAWSVS